MSIHQKFKLRKGNIKDFTALYFLYMHPSVNRFLTFEIMPQNEFKSVFDELIKNGELYVYENKENENNIAATCIVIKPKRRCRHICTLTTLAVNPLFHHQGIGTRFIKSLIKSLQKENIIRIDLYTEADNPIGHKFYEKLGFQYEGVLKKIF